MNTPLADSLRPKKLDDVVGQAHLLGPGGVLRRIIEGGQIPNMIFYGPSGTGKTTVAEIAAARMGRPLYRLNATTASLSDLRAVTQDIGTLMAPDGVLLYLDEIQYFNRRQQQSLLEFMENGSLTLIASTTDNPYFCIYSAVLSRATVFEFRPLSPEDVRPLVRRGFAAREDGRRITLEDGVEELIAQACAGDARKALNTVEAILAAHAAEPGDYTVTAGEAASAAGRTGLRYDRDGDAHYDILSAFQKSIRGSDPDAALHYLARLLESGDILSPCRRLAVIASEDIGLAYPQAAAIVQGCIAAAERLGLPEARIPLAEAAILLATAPKSNSAICAIDAAIADVRAGRGGAVPDHLRDVHYGGAQKLGHGQGYRYPHDAPRHYLPQQYLPDALAGRTYYEYGDNKTEQAARRYWDLIKGES